MRVESEKMFLATGDKVVSFEPVTFSASGALQTWTVPAGIKQIHVDCVASQGGNNGGKGGRVQCDLAVTPGATLQIMVGIVPTSINVASYNASDVRIGGTEYANRVVVAGGGGNTSNQGYVGGAGGGLTGATGAADSGKGGSGGTQSAGGAGGSGGAGSEFYGSVGTLGLGGNGGVGRATAGAGGAGYYGGGGGCANNVGISKRKNRGSGGGGGSSYANSDLCSNVVHTQGYRSGAGYITISMVS